MQQQQIRRLLSQLEELVQCPISLDVMRDPVLCTDGHTYERESILSVPRERDREDEILSPITRERMSLAHIYPNRAVQQLAEWYTRVIEFIDSQESETETETESPKNAMAEASVGDLTNLLAMKRLNAVFPPPMPAMATVPFPTTTVPMPITNMPMPMVNVPIQMQPRIQQMQQGQPFQQQQVMYPQQLQHSQATFQSQILPQPQAVMVSAMPMQQHNQIYGPPQRPTANQYQYHNAYEQQAQYHSQSQAVAAIPMPAQQSQNSFFPQQYSSGQQYQQQSLSMHTPVPMYAHQHQQYASLMQQLSQQQQQYQQSQQQHSSGIAPVIVVPPQSVRILHPQEDYSLLQPSSSSIDGSQHEEVCACCQALRCDSMGYFHETFCWNCGFDQTRPAQSLLQQQVPSSNKQQQQTYSNNYSSTDVQYQEQPRYTIRSYGRNS